MIVLQKNRAIRIEGNASEIPKDTDGLDFPEGWQSRQLGTICELRNEQVHPSDSGDLPYIGLEHIDSREHTIRRRGSPLEVRSAKNRFKAGDILYGKLRPYLDKVVIADFDGICSTDILVIRADESEAKPEFLVSALHTRSFLKYAVSTTTGVNHPRTSWNALKKYWLHIPPLPEQKAIASVLQTVQQAKEACERVIAATRQLKQSLLQFLFTYGPVPFDQADKVPLKETEIGLIPEHWEVKQAKDVFIKVTDGTHDTPDRLKSGIPLIKSAQIKGNQIDFESADYFISEKDHEFIFARSGVHPGDIVYSMIGTIGAVARVPRQMPRFSIKNVGLFKVGSDEELSGYAFYWLENQRAKEFVLKRASGTTQKYAPLGLLRKIPFPFPEHGEREEIAAQLSAVDAKISAEEARRDALTRLFQSLLHHLMTGKVRVTV